MKPLLLQFTLSLIGIIISNSVQVYAQCYELYGLTSEGGEFNNGIIFKTDINGNELKILYSFPVYEEGIHPEGKLCAANNGKYYGATKFGGHKTYGVLFEWDPSNNTYEVKYTFDGDNGSYPNGSLIQADNNKLYGMTSAGGPHGGGVLFEWDCSTNTYTIKLNFNASTGVNPYGSLVKDDNGKLYGRTWYGGLNIWGTLFEWDPSTNTYLKHLDFNQGGAGHGSLVKATNGKFYGTTSTILFEWDPATNVYVEKFKFNKENGRNPIGSLVKANNAN